MGKQVTFQFPKVNEKATKERVDDLLRGDYRYYLNTLPKDIEPKLTPSFSILPPTFSNQFHSTTEDVAIERVMFEKEREQCISKVLDAVNRLKPDEKEIIYYRFLTQEEGYDQEIWMDMGLSRAKYYRKKSQGLLRLGFILKLEVYRRR